MTKIETKPIGNPASTVESIYDMIKSFAKAGLLNAENIEALAELVTELYNRMKEGEFSGE